MNYPNELEKNFGDAAQPLPARSPAIAFFLPLRALVTLALASTTCFGATIDYEDILHSQPRSDQFGAGPGFCSPTGAVTASCSSNGAGSASHICSPTGAVTASCSSNGAGSASHMSACSSLFYRATGFISRCGESLINFPLSSDVHDIDDRFVQGWNAFDAFDLWGGSPDILLPRARAVASFSFSTDIDAAKISFKMLTTTTPSHDGLVLRGFDNLVTVFDDVHDDDGSTDMATWFELATRDAAAGVATLPASASHALVPNAICTIPLEDVHDDYDEMMTLATWLEPTTRDVAAGFVALPAATGHGVVTHAICTGPREGVHNKELLTRPPGLSTWVDDGGFDNLSMDRDAMVVLECDNFIIYAYYLFATQLSNSIYQTELGNVMNSWGDCSDTSVALGYCNDENNEDNRLDYSNPCWSADLLLDYAAPKLAMTHYTYCAVLVVHDVGICCIGFRPDDERSKLIFDVIGDYIGASGPSIADATCVTRLYAAQLLAITNGAFQAIICVGSRHGDTTFTVFPFDEIGDIATTSRCAGNVWTLVWTVRCFTKHRKLIDLYQMGGDTEHHVSGLLHWFSVTFQHDDNVSPQMVSQLFASEDDTCVSGTASAKIEYGGEATLGLCSMPSDEKVAAYLCMETSDETVQLCLPMISEIPATDNMKVTPMDYMGNVNFQYSADGDSSTIPPTYMEDDFTAAADETKTTTTKRWNWSTDNYYFFPLKIAASTWAKSLTGFSGDMHMERCFVLRCVDDALIAKIPTFSTYHSSFAFNFGIAISPMIALHEPSMWSEVQSTHRTFVLHGRPRRLSLFGTLSTLRSNVRLNVCKYYSCCMNNGDSGQEILVMSANVECVEMIDLTSYDRPDVTDDVSSELTDDLVLLRIAPMISPWPHWREILVDIGSFNYHQPAVTTVNYDYDDFLMNPGNSITHVHIDNTYGFYELDLEHYMVHPVNENDSLNTSASPAYVTYTAYKNEHDTPGEIDSQEFGTLGGLLPSNDSYDMFSRPCVHDYGSELTGVAEYKRAERECVCDHPNTRQDEGTFFVGTRVSSRMYNIQTLRFQIHGDSLV